MTTVPQQNPFQWCGRWYWNDDNESEHGPYPTQTAALAALLRYLVPPWYARLWRKLKEFVRDENDNYKSRMP